MLPEIDRITIIKLGIRNPIIHHVIQNWQHRTYSFEQAMMIAVIMLEKSNEELTQSLSKAIMNKTTIDPIIIKKPE